MDLGQDVYAHQIMEDQDGRMMEEDQADYGYAEEDELGDGMSSARAVHQCNICNKIFVSFKGLQQHSVIHTDQKPFQCDICGKTFRFKSNLFEHRSVHTGFTPHACPYCGKTCRLKGNLKKHLKTHVSTKEELEQAWRPFASNRRPPAEVPEDAIIVRSTGEPFFTPPSRPRKKKLGLGPDSRLWVDKIRRGEILPTTSIEDKVRCFDEAVKNTLKIHQNDRRGILSAARLIAFENFDCPLCNTTFMGRTECADHIEVEHPMARLDRPLFCDICLKVFADRKSLEQHESYHKRVTMMMEHAEIEITEPRLVIINNELEDDLIHGDMLAQ